MSPEERLQQWTITHGRRLCLHPDASAAACRGGIVKAHTLRRSADLARIARNGHVYGLRHNPLIPPDQLVRPQLIGVNRASTFTGFCQHHDATLFRPLEALPFEATPEQVTLLGYRTLCREVYAKRAVLEYLPTIREGDRGAPAEFQEWAQRNIGALELGNTVGLRDAEVHRARYGEAIRTGDYSTARYLVVTFDAGPDMVFTSGWYPDASFAGERLQELGDLNRTADYMTVSLITTEAGAAAVLGWLTPSPASERFAVSLDALAADAIPHAVVRFAYQGENTFSSPAWWEGLAGPDREALIRRTSLSAHPHLPALPLTDDGLRVVRWTVTDRVRQF
jgi:hypothetical protein